ncbi:MAG: thiol-activated cytolysin family protein [Candidatus Cyclobacteriaceae bacterium M3_2C_046]
MKTIIFYRLSFLYLVCIGHILFLSSCEEKLDQAEIKAREINDLINNLQYDANQLLNVQPTGSEAQLRAETNSENQSPYRQGGSLVTCIKRDYSLKTNFEDVAILRPTNGIIFPGALVIGDENMLDGAPTPLIVDRAPANLRIDLPGMGEEGSLVVENPNNSTVGAAIDDALDWWNNNAYREGYVNPAYISYKSSSSYSSEQLSLDVGLNVAWATGDVASQFNYTSSTTKKVAMLAFKQGFYSVTLNTPDSPSQLFAPEISVSDLESKINNNAPPAYVHSVIYGRIIIFRMESTTATSSAELAIALEYAAGVTDVSGSTETKIKSILANSSTTVVTIGGNAAVASEAVSAKNKGDLDKIIKGENAVYSKNNPGVPIAYTIRYLKDNEIAKMGYSTDYSVTECSKSLVPGARITIQNDAGYVVRAVARYKDANGASKSKSTGNFSAGFVRRLDLPAGAHDISLDVDYRSVFDWFDLFTHKFSVPTQRCYKTWGTLFDRRYATQSCN